MPGAPPIKVPGQQQDLVSGQSSATFSQPLTPSQQQLRGLPIMTWGSTTESSDRSTGTGGGSGGPGSGAHSSPTLTSRWAPFGQSSWDASRQGNVVTGSLSADWAGPACVASRSVGEFPVMRSSSSTGQQQQQPAPSGGQMSTQMSIGSLQQQGSIQGQSPPEAGGQQEQPALQDQMQQLQQQLLLLQAQLDLEQIQIDQLQEQEQQQLR